MNILIIEDEALAARRLEAMVKEIADDAHVIGFLSSVKSSIEWLNHHAAPDLILMDIELTDGKSFDIFEKANVTCPVIFITAYDEYAIRAFKVNSVDYLLKPVKKEELKRSIGKLRDMEKVFAAIRPPIDIRSLLRELQVPASYRQRFLIKQGDRLIPVEAKEVAYFYTRDKSNFIRTNDQHDYLVDQTLDEIEAETDPKKFFRANRQFILSIGCIEKVHMWFNAKLKVDVKPKSAEDVIVSREKATAFRQWLGE